MKKLKQFIVLAMALLVLVGCANDEQEEVEEQDTDTEAVSSTLVVTIEDQDFYEEDMAFYTFMQQLKHEFNRLKDVEGLEGEALDERNQYWAAQDDYYDNVNTQLQNLIEIHTMSLLAKEKNYFIPVEKLEEEVKNLHAVIAEQPSLQKMIDAYGEQPFKSQVRLYTEESMLRDRVFKDLEKEVREENPDATEQEINYLVNTMYDDLYEDHVSQVEMVIHLK